MLHHQRRLFTLVIGLWISQILKPFIHCGYVLVPVFRYSHEPCSLPEKHTLALQSNARKSYEPHQSNH